MPGVFDGVKVLDFTWAYAGPVTTKYLADYGATVIRVETHSHLCILRTSPPYVGGVPDVDRAAYYATYSPNKLSLGINLAHPKGKEIIRRLVVTGTRPTSSKGYCKNWGRTITFTTSTKLMDLWRSDQ